jgi:hypothetical protein
MQGSLAFSYHAKRRRPLEQGDQLAQGDHRAVTVTPLCIPFAVTPLLRGV